MGSVAVAAVVMSTRLFGCELCVRVLCFTTRSYAFFQEQFGMPTGSSRLDDNLLRLEIGTNAYVNLVVAASSSCPHL